MKTLMKTIFLAAVTMSAGLQAAVNDIPLAVTTLAHPSLLSTPTADQLKRSDEYLNRGLRFLANEETYGRAVREFEDSVRMYPRASNYKALGTAYYQMGNKAKAAWAYRQSLQLEPNKEVQALVDSFEGRERKDEQFRDEHDRIRFSRLLDSGNKNIKKDRLDSAFRDFLDAYRIMPDRKAREPLGRVGIQLVEQNVKAGNYEKSGRMIEDLRGIYGRANNITAKEEAYLARLDKAELQWAEATGQKLRKMEKALQSDEERFKREIDKEAAKHGGDRNNINVNTR